MDKNEVKKAFEILLEEIAASRSEHRGHASAYLEAVANALNEEGAQALRAGDYDKAKSAIEAASRSEHREATRLAEFREKVKGLQKEWVRLFASVTRQRTLKPRARKGKGRRKSRARLPRGLRTPEDAFRCPILETLVELGGSGARLCPTGSAGAGRASRDGARRN